MHACMRVYPLSRKSLVDIGNTFLRVIEIPEKRNMANHNLLRTRKKSMGTPSLGLGFCRRKTVPKLLRNYCVVSEQ